MVLFSMARNMVKEILINKKIQKQKVYTPKMVRELLEVDNDRISQMCKIAALVPKKNNKGLTYFSVEDVNILKNIHALQKKSNLIEKEIFNKINAKSEELMKEETTKAQAKSQAQTLVQTQGMPKSQSSTQVAISKTQDGAVINTDIARSAIDTIERLNKTLTNLEASLTTRISSVIDAKLDGMDEVVVELIQAKTENERLRFKINEMNKEIFDLKNDLTAFKPVGLNFYYRNQQQ